MRLRPRVCLASRNLPTRILPSHGHSLAEWTARLGVTRVPETPDVAATAVLVLTTAPAPHGGHLALTRMGVAYAFITVVKTSLDLPPAPDDGGDGGDRRGGALHSLSAQLLRAAAADYATAVALAADGVLHATHVAAGAEEVWVAGVEVAGRPDVAAVANASMYSLASYLRPDWPFGTSPGGLSTNGCACGWVWGGGYGCQPRARCARRHRDSHTHTTRHLIRPADNSHQFWDYDSFTFPVFALLHPAIAESSLTYRLHRLPGARAKAATSRPGARGAMFPWESAFTGVETCPTWAPTGEKEVHISSDVAMSVWQCVRRGGGGGRGGAGSAAGWGAGGVSRWW